jgi:cytochrome P450
VGAWVVSRFAACQAVLRSPQAGKGIAMVSQRLGLDAEQTRAQAEARRENRSLLWLDPPDHTRLRGLVAKAFTPKRVEALRPAVEQLAADLLDRLGGDVDLMEALANPLPVTVIGELLGVPPADRPRFLPLSRAGTLAFEPSAGPAEIAAANRAGEEMEAYFRDLFERRRADPGDDLLTELMAVEERGDVLTEQELVSTAILLFGAGFETTANLIGNGVLALLRHPDQLARLREDLSLLRPAVDELLRFDGPVQVDARTAFVDLEVDGAVVPAGEVVVALLGSANRDERRFTEPDRLDVARDDGPSLAFGAGIHHCLGAALARMEGQVVLAGLLRRFRRIELLDEAPPWRDTITMHGLEALPLRLG